MYAGNIYLHNGKNNKNELNNLLRDLLGKILHDPLVDTCLFSVI